MTFDSVGLERTDASFRAKSDPAHHLFDSPLEKIHKLDMIKKVVAVDVLHSRDVGSTKTMLKRFIKPPAHKFKRTRFRTKAKDEINEFLVNCNTYMPSECHRAVRSLNAYKFWKAVEFRQFFFYIAPIVYKYYLPPQFYQHFLMLYCAFTICTAKRYSMLLDIAENIFSKCVALFATLYGKTTCTMNVHLLFHVVEDTRMFGPTDSFASYKYENCLAHIKKLLRSHRDPLPQIANRVSERNSLILKYKIDAVNYPILKNFNGIKYYEIIVTDGIKLNSSDKNKWFKTKSEEVVAFEFAKKQKNGDVFLYGRSLKFYDDFFDFPFASSVLNIHTSNAKLNRIQAYKLDSFDLKMIGIKYKKDYVFIPMIHSLDL